MSKELKQEERGQNLLIFAVLMVVLVALAGLVIDGGFSLAKRRMAQNAADAGALAGADALCAGNPILAEQVALDYAINRNGATTAEVITDTKVITVNTTIPHDTFLMGLFGSDIVTTTATASAGCYLPCSASVLPVAWSCQPPEVNGVPITDTCGTQYGTEDSPGPLYIIMDSQQIEDDIFCQYPPNSGEPAGAMDCDLDNELPYVNELMAGGNRSWLNLDGGNVGNSELVDWIGGINVPELFTYHWYGGTPGNKEVAYQAIEDEDLIGEIVLIPVFDRFCDGVPADQCPSLYDPGDDTVLSSNSLFYYRVIQFSAFRITCVVAPGVNTNCLHPARTAAITALTDQGILNCPNVEHCNNVSTIEGYFVKDYVGTGKCEGPDTGVYTIYLNH